MHPSLGRSGARRHLLRAGHDLVDEAVLPGLLRGEPAVPVGVLLDLLDGLAGVEGEPLLHGPLGVEHLLGLDGNVGGGAAQPTGRLMHHDPRVREGIALAGRAGAEQELCAGAPGKRYALPHARIMMHQPSGGLGGTASDIAIQAEQMLYTKRTLSLIHISEPTRLGMISYAVF